MGISIFDAYPRGYSNPVNFRPSAALPAAGAWDPVPVESFSVNAKNLTLYFTYTRGAAGGAFDWQIEVSPYSVASVVPAGAAEWVTEAVQGTGVVALGADTQSRNQREYQTYGSQGGAAEDFVIGPIELQGTVERIRVRARESADGIQANPGTLQIEGVIV